MCDSSRPRGSEMMCLWESHTRVSSSIWWPKLRIARISDYSLSSISVAFVHARTDEGIFVKKLSSIKSSRFGRLKASVNGTRKASKHWQEFSGDKLATKKLFQRKDIVPCIYKRFCSTATIFCFV